MHGDLLVYLFCNSDDFVLIDKGIANQYNDTINFLGQ